MSSSEDRFFELSTEMLRSLLKEFGFGIAVDSMSHQELLKKYLVVTANINVYGNRKVGKASNDSHSRGVPNRSDSDNTDNDNSGQPRFHSSFQTKKSDEVQGTNGGYYRKEKDTSDPGAPDTKAMDAAQKWLNEWNKRIRAERDKEREQARERQQEKEKRKHVDREADEDTDRDKSRALNADELRKQRVDKLAAELPTMGGSDLRRLMLVSGVSADGCIEKEDMLERIYNHFGISVQQHETERGTERKTQKKKNDTGVTMTPAEAAYKAAKAMAMHSNGNSRWNTDKVDDRTD